MNDEAETVYSSRFEPDPMNALHVLAFLLVPEAAFFDATDGPEVRIGTIRLLREAKREALLNWYAAHEAVAP